MPPSRSRTRFAPTHAIVHCSSRRRAPFVVPRADYKHIRRARALAAVAAGNRSRRIVARAQNDVWYVLRIVHAVRDARPKSVSPISCARTRRATCTRIFNCVFACVCVCSVAYVTCDSQNIPSGHYIRSYPPSLPCTSLPSRFSRVAASKRFTLALGWWKTVREYWLNYHCLSTNARCDLGQLYIMRFIVFNRYCVCSRLFEMWWSYISRRHALHSYVFY